MNPRYSVFSAARIDLGLCAAALLLSVVAGNAIGAADAAAAPRARVVIVNGKAIDDTGIAALERAYRVRVHAGEYWYDKVSGAWGLRGGPAAGVIAAGLNLGGPLRADASGGNTGVFVNGRQLHALDVAALRRLGPVIPGRYWIDRFGNYGFENGLRLGNLYAAAQTLQAPRQGILSTWDKTGVSVYNLR